MKTVSLRNVILAAVATVSSIGTMACTSCPTTETVRNDEKELEPARVCAAIDVAASRNTSTCRDLCGDGYNACQVDSAYLQELSRVRNGDADAGDAGPAPATACPVPTDGKATVGVRCYETKSSSELSLGGGCTVEGRRPERLLPALPRRHDAPSLGQYFAEVAHLEAAAVLAFEHMLLELEAHGAPAEIVAAARAARVDELRHARATTKIALRFGARPPAACMAPTPVRGLLAVALENEIEGVVRETLGAAIATWRAEHATDADVRAVMSFIAADERRHAELSWAISAWVRTQLDAVDVAILDERRRAAIDELPLAFANEPAPEVQHAAGAPGRAQVQRLIATLDDQLWSTAA